MLKASHLRIGKDCGLGALSVVLYDSIMEDGALLDDLSLLMKGERLAAGTAWAGIPAEWRAVQEAERHAEEQDRAACSAA